MLLQAYTYVRVTAGDIRSRIHGRFVELAKSEAGATAAEYALLIALIAVVIIVGAGLLGDSINTKLSNTSTAIDTAG